MTPLRMMKTGETHMDTLGGLHAVFTDADGRRWIIERSLRCDPWWYELPQPPEHHLANQVIAACLALNDKP